ncbi:MAG: hypothetical protein ACRDRW_05870 [Pseudonocardiaceae bacterium]
MRSAVSIPQTNTSSLKHSDLVNAIAQADGAQVYELGQLWTKMSSEILDFGAILQGAETSSRSIWIGQAGTAARVRLSELATWCQATAEKMQHMGGTVMRNQAEAVETAQRSMPAAVPYDPAAYQNRINSTNNPSEWLQIQGDAYAQAARHDAAYAEAVQVIETYIASLLSTNGMMPAFTPPPELDTRGTGPGPRVPTPGGNGGAPGSGAGGGRAGGSPSSGNSQHIAPTPGGSGPGGGSPVPGGHNPVPGGGGPDGGGHPLDSMAPASTPGQLASHVPGISGPSSPAGGGTGIPSLPSVPAGIGEIGAERRRSGVGVGRGGGFGPRGSGAVTALGRSGFGSTGNAESVTGAGKGITDIPSRGPGSGPGAGGAFPPMVGGGQGRGEQDTEHRRPSYLIETEDIWGDGSRVAPPVIGEDPPEYHY